MAPLVGFGGAVLRTARGANRYLRVENVFAIQT